MFSISFLSNFGVLIWHQIIIVFAVISKQIRMFLGRSESLKWIRRKFSKRNNSNPTSQNEHTPAKISKTHNENCENIRDLNEILVITSSTSRTQNSVDSTPTQPLTIQSDEVMSKTNTTMLSSSTNDAHQQLATAPIAREEECAEDVEEMEESHEEWGIKQQIANDENMLKTNNNNHQQEQQQQQQQDEQQQFDLQLQLEQHHYDVINENLVRRSKSSRVRNYLKKCKDRWLSVANNGHNAEHNDQHTRHDSTTTTITLSTVMEPNVSQHLSRPIEVTVPNANDSMGEGITPKSVITTTTAACHRRDGHSQSNCALGSVLEIEDDDIDDADGYHEDNDFGFRGCSNKSKVAKEKDVKLTSKTKANNEANSQSSLEEVDPMQLVNTNNYHEDVKEIIGKQLVDSIHMESHIASLIDNHLACIYPVFNQTTRAVLLREARDVLVKTYHGCLTTFQRQFLCKFAEIAVVLKERHRIGEALIWCQGWPLVTPIGEVILHLGDLDDVELKPAEIYLCVKTADANDIPQLYANWRTPTVATPNTIAEHRVAATTSSPGSGSTLKSCQLNCQDNTLYLSALTLEMLNDDLPQLLQSLLIGVEHNLERLSLNQLSPTAMSTNYDASNNNMKLDIASPQQEQQNANNNDTSSSSNITITKPLQSIKIQLPNSPKCGLRRSELITKNKLHNNKYMLRRFTNRQDSMNSTSSGNSSASGLSNASSSFSDSPSYGKTLLTNTVNGHSQANTVSHSSNNANETTLNDSNTSPALPRFCLGTSFPHIDSDEENSEERRHSLTDDQLESEITPPNLITDLPEKLLLSGIYLPGTRDVKGNPLVTVDAESVVTAGINCYEIATLLLYYSTIPERSGQNSNNNSVNAVNDNVEISTSPQRSSNYAATTSTAAVTTPITTTCTSLNDNVQQSQQQQQQQNEHVAKQLQQQQQQHVTFTILIAIEKSQHLCVIDLISQSLKLLTRHIAYCHLLVVCCDSTLLLNVTSATNNNTSTNANTSTTATNEDIKATCTTSSINDSLNEKSSTFDTNGKLRCHKKTDTHTIIYMTVDDVTTSGGVVPTATPSGRLGGLHHHDARKWREFFVHYEPFYQECASAAQRLVAALNDIRHADLQGLPTRRQLYAQHRALSRALMDSELHNLRKRSAATIARLQELAKSINSNNTNNDTNSYVVPKANSYCSLKSKTSGGVSATAAGGSGLSNYYTSTLNRSKILGSSSGYSFNYQGNQNNKTSQSSNNNSNNNNNNSHNSHNVSTISATKSLATMSSSSTTTPSSTASALTTTTPTTATTTINPLIKSSIYSITSSCTTTLTTASRFSANNSIVNNTTSAAILTAMPIDANTDVAIRLQKVSLLYTEIDRAAKRLEQLTEQRREHLRELTRQRALEDEINEVSPIDQMAAYNLADRQRVELYKQNESLID